MAERIEVEKLQIQAAGVQVDIETSSVGGTGTRVKLPKLPNLVVEKDDMDTKLTRRPSWFDVCAGALNRVKVFNICTTTVYSVPYVLFRMVSSEATLNRAMMMLVRKWPVGPHFNLEGSRKISEEALQASAIDELYRETNKVLGKKTIYFLGNRLGIGIISL
ncbi:hypothetical protein PoB_000213600 [Plakobranchus ocellatus]|uniref:Uncharacterized protein n=1 Tax=Plakobranchus ocellatus TaxID=259542 RepID=A0AAV3XXQ8_9GAST|nr:hypothetical protein PoB_000213600 [Plakobranchus ocellatus]